MKHLSDEDLIERLQQMPKVKDRLSENAWKERVQASQFTRQRTKRKRTKMIPILSTALMLGILVLIIPSFFDGETPMVEDVSAPTKMFTTKSADLSDEAQDHSMGATVESSEETEEVAEELGDRGTYVLYEPGEDEQLVYGGTVDEQAQYLIPLTFVTRTDLSLSDAYNALPEYMTLIDHEESVPYFDDVRFDINTENKTVVMHTAPNYSIGEGSAIQGKFEDMLITMFDPYGIDTIIFEQSSGEPVSLGEMGEYEEISLREPIQSNYKRYDDGASERSFFIPIYQLDRSFPEAVTDLKNGDRDFNVHQTIPEQVDPTVTCDDNVCTVELSGEVTALTEEEAIILIESVLMTAKSYGYMSVQFNGFEQSIIGDYDVTQPIDVPLAVNPITIDE